MEKNLTSDHFRRTVFMSIFAYTTFPDLAVRDHNNYAKFNALYMYTVRLLDLQNACIVQVLDLAIFYSWSFALCQHFLRLAARLIFEKSFAKSVDRKFQSDGTVLSLSVIPLFKPKTPITDGLSPTTNMSGSNE